MVLSAVDSEDLEEDLSEAEAPAEGGKLSEIGNYPGRIKSL